MSSRQRWISILITLIMFLVGVALVGVGVVWVAPQEELKYAALYVVIVGAYVITVFSGVPWRMMRPPREGTCSSCGYD